MFFNMYVHHDYDLFPFQLIIMCHGNGLNVSLLTHHCFFIIRSSAMSLTFRLSNP